MLHYSFIFDNFYLPRTFASPRLQCHISIDYDLVDGVRQNMERLGALGLEVHITELDVSCTVDGSECEEWGATQESMQAEVYAALLQACLDVPACTNFETWGFTDAHTWKGVGQHPLPFDENYAPKLAVRAMLDTLAGNKSWVQAYNRRVG